MKICFLVPWITKGRGGTENVGQMMATAMSARGHDVDIVTFDTACAPARWPLPEKIALHHVIEEPGVQQDAQLLLTLASIAPDLVVGLHMNRTFLTYVRAARKLELPLVLSEHQDPRFPERLGNFDTIERQIAFQGATRVHLLIDAFVQTLPQHLRGRVRVIANTVPAAETLADPGGTDRPALVTVARLVERKNMHLLLEEFAQVASAHPKWTLRVIGGGPLQAELETAARALGVAEQVVFTGEIEDVYGELSRAQCFVLPSLFEGFPMSSLEAMAHGLPIIGFASCNGLNVQVAHGVNGQLAERPLEPGSLAREMDALMRNPKVRRRMGAASLQRYQTDYANEVIFDQWEALFAEAQAAGAPPRLPVETRLQAALDHMVFGDPV